MQNILDQPPPEIKKGIQKGNITVGVFGLGWMGLPTACLLVETGAKVIGVDTDLKVVETLRAGKSHINEPGIQQIITRYLDKRFSITSEVRRAATKVEVALIVVPTTIEKTRKPNYSQVERVCKDIGLVMRRGCIVIVESTVGPGVTETVAGKTLEYNSGLKAGKDFGLAYSPIRAMSGRVMKDLQTYPRIVSGIDKRSLDAASAVLSAITKARVIKVKDLKTAETTKLFENIYRDVNIALATELALFCEKTGLDFMKVRDAAITQPYCHLHVPRVGVGGHCIPTNPYFLIAEAESIGLNLRLMKYTRRVNDQMPTHIVNLIAKGLKYCKKKLKQSRIAVLGITYRNDVKEVSNSPALKIVDMIIRRGGRVKIFDPFFSTEEIREMGFNATESVEKAVLESDCVLIAAGHQQFKHLKMVDVARLVKRPACIIDGWRVIKAEDAKANNLAYYGVGFGWPEA